MHNKEKLDSKIDSMTQRIVENPYEHIKHLVMKWGLWDSAFERFLMSRRKSPETLAMQSRRIKGFFKDNQMMPSELIKLCKTIPDKAQDLITSWILGRVNAVSASDADQSLRALQAFLRMNQVQDKIDFEFIRENIPKYSRIAKDTAIPRDVINVLYSNADIRDKAVMQLLAHGFREGAFYFPVQKDQNRRGYFDYLRIKDLHVIKKDIVSNQYQVTPFLSWRNSKETNNLVCGRLVVYRDEDEEYQPLITLEALYVLSDYIDLRVRHGETITEDSPLFRDIWAIKENIAKRDKNLKHFEPDNIKAVTGPGIATRLQYLYYKLGIRTEYKGRKGRHEFKLLHGWRKFANTMFKTYMRTDYAEYQLGHLTHYFRPELEQHIEEFKKVIPNLTLDKAKNLELEMQKRDKEYYDKIRVEVAREIEGKLRSEEELRIRKIVDDILRSQ